MSTSNNRDDEPPDKVVFVRLDYIIGENGVLPISRSTWYSGIKRGIYPSPRRLGPRMSVWPKHEIDALCAAVTRSESDKGP